MHAHIRESSTMATARKHAPSGYAGRTPPPQPDYPDEITPEQLEAIRQLADPDGTREKGRTLLYSPAW